MEDFDTFWKAYPRKVAKGDARKAWIQTEKIRPSLSNILEAIENQKNTQQWMENEGMFIPYPATWLRQERWDDEVKIEVPKALSKTMGAIVALEQWKRGS
jgi:hypothetical protein